MPEAIRPPTILIAEDDSGNYFLLNHYLKEFECNTFRAENGWEAINTFKSKTNIDLVFMDIRMPVMDGIKASEIIKSLNKDVPIIITTAFDYTDKEKEKLEEVCDKVVVKPITHKIIKEIFIKFIQ
ncbi:MAG: response regulator [Bacteroidetes bacterium]|nr:response regulator [Bacteroidota bacterium]